MKLPKARWARWFLLGGLLGLLMPLFMWLINPRSPTITLILCPTSIVGMAEPKNRLGMVVLFLIIFGGNFLLYGAIGAVAGLVSDEHS